MSRADVLVAATTRTATPMTRTERTATRTNVAMYELPGAHATQQ